MKNFFWLFIITSAFIFSCGPSLQESGIPAEGTIISKYETGFGKNKKYYITVNFFTQPDLENPEPQKQKDSNRTVDEIIADLDIGVNFGDYTTADISVTLSEYDLHHEGEEITIKYEKGNPTHAVIAEE